MSHVMGFVLLSSCLWHIVSIAHAQPAAGDWPMFGRQTSRNSVVPDGVAPRDWDTKSGRNIKWSVPVGTSAMVNPVVAGGHVYIGTNNQSSYLPRYPKTVDLGCL